MRADFKDTHVIDPATVEGISEEQLLEQALKIPGAQLLSADELTIICELTAGAYSQMLITKKQALKVGKHLKTQEIKKLIYSVESRPQMMVFGWASLDKLKAVDRKMQSYRIADLLGMDVTLLGCSVRVDTQHIIATKEQMLDIQKTFS